MAYNVFMKNDEGLGLEVAGGKLKAKIDPKATNKLTVSDSGLLVEVEIPQQTTAVTRGSISGNTITLTKSNGISDTIELPTLPVDVKLSGATFENGVLKLTLSDNSEITVDLTASILTDLLVNAGEADKAKLRNLFLALVRGEEVKNLGDETRGYLLRTN